MTNKEKNIYHFIRPYIKEVIFIIIISIISNCLVLSFPLVIKLIIDDVILNNNQDVLLLMISIFAIIVFSGQILSVVLKYTLTMTSQLFVYRMKYRIFEKMLNIPLREINKYTEGEILSFYNIDIANINNFLINNIFIVVNDIISIGYIAVVLFLLNWQLTLISFMPIPFYCLVIYISKKIVSRLYKKIRELSGEENALYQDNIKNIILTKIFHLQKKQFAKYVNLQNNLIGKNVNTTIIVSLFMQLAGFFALLSKVFVLYWGARFIGSSVLSIGGLTAFFTYVNRVYSPIENLANVNISFEKFMVSLKKLYEIYDKKEEDYDESGLDINESLEGTIKFERVSFSYNNKQVINDFSLEIEQGRKVAILGKNGSGKSTLFNLLLRLYQMDSGGIFIGNRNIEHIPVSFLRKKIAYLTQDEFFYNTTIFENLTILNGSKTKNEIIDTAKKTGCMDFIQRNPKNFDEILGKGGINFSGGQLRNIALTRIFLKGVKIILLDEPFAPLDKKTQNNFLNLFNEVYRDCTVLFTSHQDELLSLADLIVTMDNGRIIDVKDRHSKVLEEHV